MSDSEDGDLRMLFPHQVDVIEDVGDVVVDRLDVHSMPVALPVSDCFAETKKRKILLQLF